jgi:hypothetical protein
MNDTQRSKAFFYCYAVSHLVILGVIVPVCVLVLIVTFSFCYAECSDTGCRIFIVLWSGLVMNVTHFSLFC